MNLFEFCKENVNMNKIQKFSGDIHEMAIVRYVIKQTSKIFYRDYTFFLDKENVKARNDIYNKKIDLSNIQDFNIVCKSYCNIIKELLKKNFDIDSELISPFNDEFKHVDLMIKTKKGNSYIVDPLTDLVEMQVGLRTNNFASKKYYDKLYAGKVKNISFINDKELEQIDDSIGYKSDGIYLDDFLNLLKIKLENTEEILQKDQKTAIKLLGTRYNEEGINDKQKTDLKLKFICKYLNNRKNINGIVDLFMFTKNVIRSVFTKEEQQKISVYNFFVDEKDLKNNDLRKIFKEKEDRKRGICIKFDKKNYIISLAPDAQEYDDEKWKKIVEDNNIFVKPQYSVKLLKYLKSKGADRNTLHNHEFLKQFSKFEKYLLSTGQTLEDIINNNISIRDGVIYTKIKDRNISYKIENGNLIIKDYKKNCKYTVFYQDEGRDISYKTEEIIKENQKVHLYEFDSNGLIDLEDNTGVENLVEPLSNGKYLSRNASYYKAKSYSELACERKNLGRILTEDDSKRNFVILEYLSNASGKVYFEELKKMIEKKENNVVVAQKCFEEDCENLVRLFNNEPLQKPLYDLPEGDSKILERHIEMDNKQILYMFCSNLKFSKQKHILTPGLGSIFVGPILKSMYGFDYTNILFSLYSKDEKLRNISDEKNFEDLCSNNLWNTTENEIILIDDNVASCNTMNTLRQELEKRGRSCKYGAIKYNWDFYNQVKHGKLDHSTFDIKTVDFLTILDDPGYWIMRDSINALKEKNGDAYVKMMKQEGLRQAETQDIQVLLQLAEKYSKDSGINLYDMTGEKIKKSSAFLCIKLKEQIKEIINDIPFQDRGRDE